MSKEVGIRVRMTEDEKEIIKANTLKNNFRSVSEYLRFLGMNTTIEIKQNDKKINT